MLKKRFIWHQTKSTTVQTERQNVVKLALHIKRLKMRRFLYSRICSFDLVFNIEVSSFVSIL